MSARLYTEIDDKDVWLTAFTETMEVLMSKAGLPKDAKSDEIANGLLLIENMKVLIYQRSNFITKFFAFLLVWTHSSKFQLS